jgi:peptide deformylase
MALLPIRLYGDPILREKSQPIEEIDESHLSLALDMLETMRHEEGIGLAAIQVGLPIRLLVADVGDRAPKGVSKIFINPEILEATGEWVFDEGCLSIPGITAEITRPKKILLRYIDGKGKQRTDEFDELHARVLLHEIDHLDGKLFVDYLSPIRRTMIMKKLRALQKSSGRNVPAL